MRLLLKLSILVVAIAVPLFAQSGPAPAAETTPGDFSVGYSFLDLSFAGKPAVRFNGIDAAAMITINPSWAATVDTSFYHAGRDIESGHASSVLSALAGPVFTVARRGDARILARGLVGVSVVDGSVPVDQVYFRGYESRFSWAVGAGYERSLSASYAVRFNVDYLRTHFVDNSAAVAPQNGIRLGANFVFRFSPRRESHRISREPN